MGFLWFSLCIMICIIPGIRTSVELQRFIIFDSLRVGQHNLQPGSDRIYTLVSFLISDPSSPSKQAERSLGGTGSTLPRIILGDHCPRHTYSQHLELYLGEAALGT